MRKFIIGNYDTALTGFWTLAGWSLSPARYQSNIVQVPGSSVPLDLSTVLTDGEPTYDGRTLTIQLESSEGDRLTRKSRIDTMINQLDGWRMNIILPDDPDHYLVGRVHVAENYNDLAHASVTVTATCDPWKYYNTETVVTLQATETEQIKTLVNSGRKTVVPLLTVTGGTLSLSFGSASWTLSAGAYQLPDLVLRQGSSELTYSGTGTATLTYREAVL